MSENQERQGHNEENHNEKNKEEELTQEELDEVVKFGDELLKAEEKQSGQLNTEDIPPIPNIEDLPTDTSRIRNIPRRPRHKKDEK